MLRGSNLIMLLPSQESRSWRVRVVRLPVAHPDALAAVVDVDRRAFYAEVSKQAEAAKAVFDSAGLVYPDVFVGFEIMCADCSVASVLAGLHRVTSSMSSGVCEVRSRRFSHKCVCVWCVVCARFIAARVQVMVHPGFVVDPALPSGCGSPADDFSMSVERETEMECLYGMRPALAFVVVLHFVPCVTLVLCAHTRMHRCGSCFRAGSRWRHCVVCKRLRQNVVKQDMHSVQCLCGHVTQLLRTAS
jgi:hypothetical protein